MLENGNDFTQGEIGLNMPSSRREKEEDMLEIFCKWRRKGISLSASRICQYFGMSKRDLNYYVKQMVKHGYMLEPDGTDELKLTEFGKAQGEECCYRHDSLTQFLQLMGLDKHEAEEDACRMEHVVREKTVQQICDFMNYGDIYERVLNNTNLAYRYEPGDYQFLMGIYRMEQRYPRRLAEEFYEFSDRAVLEIRKEGSWFRLMKKTEKNLGELWFKDQEIGWVNAEETEAGIRIPTDIFEFTISPRNSITEGVALVAFVKAGEQPTEWNCRELNVHIW